MRSLFLHEAGCSGHMTAHENILPICWTLLRNTELTESRRYTGEYLFVGSIYTVCAARVYAFTIEHFEIVNIFELTK